MERECDQRVIEYWQITGFYNIAKLIWDTGIDDDVGNIDGKNTMLLKLGFFDQSKSKRIMKKNVRAIDGFEYDEAYYTDNDSLYKEKKCWEILERKKLVGEEMGQGRNEYEMVVF